ncbi:MAG TPA: alpha/beta hydrolase, partial [Caulobacteraceae bacterium]|nr:alpha/beta hydrolase [Caulobacteraceae bacterium]
MAVIERKIAAPADVRHGDLVVSDGVRIHWMEAGGGVPIVLLHGYTSCCDAGWFANGIAAELARDHRVIGIDARGHGRSEKPHDPAKYPGDRMPADVIEVLDHLGVGKAHFHGYSMGGGIVAHLMARHPRRFITASFGGSGVLEEDEALAAQATERNPKGLDPQQEAGQRALRERADRDDVVLKCVQDGRLAKPSTAPPLDLASLNFPIQAINGEFDGPVSKTQRLAREAKDF